MWGRRQFAEKDSITNTNNFQLRLYEPRFGRWLSAYPYGQYGSSYLAMGNNPISRTDSDGGFDTWFGAAWYSFWHGGGEIIFNEEGSFYQVNQIFASTEGSFGMEIRTVVQGTAMKIPTSLAAPALTGVINFDAGVNQKVVSNYTRTALKEIMRDAGITAMTITSTARTPDDQARIMHGNIAQYGADAQKKLYGPNGQKVIDEYPDQEAMLAKINELGPSNVSKHIADPKFINVVDIRQSSISNTDAFEKVIKNSMKVHRYFMPPLDPAYHLEFLQPK